MHSVQHSNHYIYRAVDHDLKCDRDPRYQTLTGTNLGIITLVIHISAPGHHTERGINRRYFIKWRHGAGEFFPRSQK